MQLKQEADKILDNTLAMGMTDIILQVRPTADALYQTDYYPWSKYISGTQGVAPEFDILQYYIEGAHTRGLKLHAWINPYRITVSEADNDRLAANNPAVTRPQWVVKHTDGKLYFDPGIPAARQYIIDGICDIVYRYNVDGIHIDDYFYPGKDFPDSQSFAQYGGGFSSIDAWRTDNNDLFVRDLNHALHSIRGDIVFGVSPAGIWANKKSHSLGSDTNGKESYYSSYADTRGWVKNGWMDYIAPQIYWNIGYNIADYSILTDWWQTVTAGTGVKLYIGQAAYRTGDADAASPWHGIDEIGRQIDYNRSVGGVDGYIQFRYQNFVDNPLLFNLIARKNGKVGFDDLEGYEWAKDAILHLREQSIIYGVTDTQYAPGQGVTRADMTLLLVRCLGLQDTFDNNFDDVLPGDYYYDQVGIAKKHGLALGMGGNLFWPTGHVTRQDMFTLAHRILQQKGISMDEDATILSGYADATLVRDYARAPFAVFVHFGAVWTPDNLLAPFENATRADCAYLVDRIYRLIGG